MKCDGRGVKLLSGGRCVFGLHPLTLVCVDLAHNFSKELRLKNRARVRFKVGGDPARKE
jgi:hypothetical protein